MRREENSLLSQFFAASKTLIEVGNNLLQKQLVFFSFGKVLSCHHLRTNYFQFHNKDDFFQKFLAILETVYRALIFFSQLSTTEIQSQYVS